MRACRTHALNSKPNAISDAGDDPSFLALPLRMRGRVDRAFDSFSKLRSANGEEPARKKRKLASRGTASGGATPGGFLLEGTPEAGGFISDAGAGGFLPEDSTLGGGFLPESSDEDENAGENDDGARPDTIPFNLIPSALQLLDLQPDDEDVLSVFRNAATGWENERGAPEDDAHLFVSRKDWRAVCAALLNVGGEDDAEDVDDEAVGDNDPELSRPSEEEYVESEDGSEEDEEDEDSDDEYQGGGFVRTKAAGTTSKSKTASKRGKGRGTTESSLSPLEVSDDEDLEIRPKRITPRQKAEARRAFAMFFPNVPDKELDKQKIMIKDIARTESLINLKSTADEASIDSFASSARPIVQMLSAFSTSPDKSMSLRDFERMMVAAKLA
ncbi:uncharacterized protein PHACADRAFT_104370 [Phanerochaete carnosa HHB-10118-sp]|uniref:Uncharacterized protein n=1 Tax=Phanerochaete carnosa (strain HHB-10118-sp) TaxID=650164 RepID=K5VUH1_PHACS|nr:uncharacterized protein PHACADRAFT_104370 [Phanerochaete carnosa HHB-10118-sp]EKM50445.1 hypothetical protein PHACADRAFT_104370 [Phanerochaete carnosa HHB-10118-sp]